MIFTFTTRRLNLENIYSETERIKKKCKVKLGYRKKHDQHSTLMDMDPASDFRLLLIPIINLRFHHCIIPF